MKRIRTMIALGLTGLVLAGYGNWDIVDTQYAYDYAIIRLPNGEVVEGQVESWNGGDTTGRVMVKIDGVSYLVGNYNVVLIEEEPNE